MVQWSGLFELAMVELSDADCTYQSSFEPEFVCVEICLTLTKNISCKSSPNSGWFHTDLPFQILGANSGLLQGQHGSHKQQRRMLSIHEYLAMNILRENGVSVPKYEVADSAQQAFDIASHFGKFVS